MRGRLATVSTDSSGTDSDTMDSDKDARRNIRHTYPNLHELSREQLIQKLNRMRRHGTQTPKQNYMALFAKRAREANTRFRGTPPAKFALGTEPFANFRERFVSYAITSGWDDTQQVVAMLRFLEGRAATIFNEWINQGHFVEMDADVMWRKLEKRFCDPSEERQTARMDLSLRLQRSGESIQVYEQVFMELAKRAELTEEEMVAQWVKNIEPHLADRCRMHTSLRDLSFEEVVTVARRAGRQAAEVQQPQVTLNKTEHAIPTKTSYWSGEVDGGTPEGRTLSIQAIADTVRKQLAQEMASKQHLEDTVEQLKRELSTLQVLQVQQDHVRSAPRFSVASLQAIKDDMTRELAARQVEVVEAIGRMQRSLDGIKVMQVRQETQFDDRGRPPDGGRERAVTVGDRKGRGRQPNVRIELPEGICRRCGSKDHRECDWKEPCEHCGRPGHKSEVCFTRLREQQSRTGTK